MARRLGVRLEGARAPSPGRDRYRSVARGLASAGVDGVVIAGLNNRNAYEFVRAIRAVLGRRLVIIAPDSLLPASENLRAIGPAAAGMYLTGAVITEPARQLPPAGREFVRELSATQQGRAVNLFTPFAAQAAEVLLAAIAHSDGTRASVTRQLFRVRIPHGILGPVEFDKSGDIGQNLIPVFRVRPAPRGVVYPEDPVYEVLSAPVRLVRWQCAAIARLSCAREHHRQTSQPHRQALRVHRSAFARGLVCSDEREGVGSLRVFTGRGGKMRRFAVALTLLLAVAAVTAGGAGSRTSKSTFQVFVEPTVSAASNGLTLESELEGSFNVASKTASGSGTFAVMAGTTVLESGTFTLTRLVAFQFYGCGEVTTPDGRIQLPPDFCGGRAIFAVHATTSSGEQGDGLLEVNCQIHDPGGQAPPGTSEGVKVNARGINFNKHVTGDNLIVMTP